jgi:hypothetical protein
VDFFPPDLARQVRKHHKRFDAGIRRGLASPPAWRAAEPGKLREALLAQASYCHQALNKPVPLEDLVEELGVLAVLVLDANDPLAAAHGDPREPRYAHSYLRYVESVQYRVRLVYYGQNDGLIHEARLEESIGATLDRSRNLYPFIGDEFFRTGSLRDWRSFDDRSVAFGVAGISLSRALTDLANFSAFVWKSGGGLIPKPRPTPTGHVGETVTLSGGFRDGSAPSGGKPVMPRGRLALPPVNQE